MKLAAGAINHLLQQDPRAKEQLRTYAGKTVRLALTPFETLFTITADGEFQPSIEGATAEASIRLGPSAALRILANEPPEKLVKVEGDTELATEIGKILRQLNWEYEEDLSKLIGDVPAHELVTFGKNMLARGQRQATILAEMFVEYWQEEQPMIAKRRHVEQFTQDVNTLRDDTERLAKRVERLEKSQEKSL